MLISPPRPVMGFASLNLSYHTARIRVGWVDLDGTRGEPQQSDGRIGWRLGRKPMTGYAETYRRSLERPDEFWAEAAEAIDWERRWDKVLDKTRPPFFSLVCRRAAQYLLECARPPYCGGTRRPRRTDLGQSGYRTGLPVHLS